MTKSVLIVSSGRTGTQFLAHYLAGNYEDVVALHEPKPRYRVRLAANAHAAGSLSRERLVRLLARRRRQIATHGRRLYIESNPFLWGAVDVFDEVWDDPVVIHVVRDPRTQVRSSLNHGSGLGLKGIANRWLPFWSPSLGSRALVRGSEPIARAAGVWSVVNQRLSQEGKACADYHLFRYEALFDAEHSGLRALCRLLGLEFRGAGAQVDPSRRVNRAERNALPAWEAWSDDECTRLDRICAPLMGDYGYGLEADWRARVSAGRET